MSNDPLLFRGYAHAVGYGVKQSYENFRIFVAKSAENGSAVASLVLECLENQTNGEGALLTVFMSRVEGGSSIFGQDFCRFRRQTPQALDGSSFSSADGCHALHYLPSFESLALENGPYHGHEIIKRRYFGISIGEERSHRIAGLKQIIERLGTQQLNEATKEVHYIHPHFPLSLTGTPLAFAVVLGCQDSVDSLLSMGADPFEPIQRSSGEEKLEISSASALYASITSHRSEIFRQLWSWQTPRNRHQDRDIFNLIFENIAMGSRLISALAEKSILERMILHGSQQKLAETNMIQTMISALSKFAEQQSPQNGKILIVELVSKGVQGILALGDLDIARELMRLLCRPGTCSYHNICSEVETLLRRDVVDNALRIACSGSFDLDESALYLQFAREFGMDLNVDARATKMIMTWKAVDFFEHCLENGLRIDHVDEDGRTSLHYAVTNDFFHQSPMLVNLSDNPMINVADNGGITPLHLAVSLGNLKITELLLKHGANVNAANSQGDTVLHYATQIEDKFEAKHFCDILLKANANPLYPNNLGLMPLHQAAQRWQTNELSTVLNSFISDAQCDINAQDLNGHSILHQAAAAIEETSVSIILRFGASVYLSDNKRRTALHVCAQTVVGGIKQSTSSRALKSVLIANLMLDAGANALAKDIDDLTPMDYAVMNGNDPLLSLFLQRLENRSSKLDSNQYNTNYETAVSSAWSFAILVEQWSVVKALLLMQPTFEKDLSLLKWPAGARFLRYMLESEFGLIAQALRSDEYLSNYADEYFEKVQIVRKRVLNEYDRSSESAYKAPKLADLPSEMSEADHWTADDLQRWEDLVDASSIHCGGEVLAEIFSFLKTWEQSIVRLYFGDASKAVSKLI